MDKKFEKLSLTSMTTLVVEVDILENMPIELINVLKNNIDANETKSQTYAVV